MSGADIPKFSHEHDTSADTSRPEIFTGLYDLDLADKMQELKSALDNDRRADRASYTFGFYDDRSLEQVYLPPQARTLLERCGPLNSISLDCASPNDYDALSFTVSLDFKNDEGMSTRLVVDRPFDYKKDEDSYDTVIINLADECDEDGDSDTANYHEYMTPISRDDFNRLLASLVYKGGDNISIEAFSALNWHNEDFERTIKNFHYASDCSTSYEEYLLTSEKGELSGALRVHSYDETVTDIQLDRIIEHDAFIDEQGNLHYSKRIVEAWVTPVGDPTTSFWTCAEHNDDQLVWEELDLATTNYSTTINFIDIQLRTIQPPHIVSFDDDTTQPPEDY